MIKLIISDMDGSLLNNKKELPPDIFEIIQDCIHAKIEFTIGSGRSFASLNEMFTPVINDINLICDNGACVISKGETLFTSVISKDKVHFFIKEGRKHPHVHTILCTTTGAFVENKDNITPDALEEIIHYYPFYKNCDDLLMVTDDILKICYLDLRGAADNIYASLLPFTGNPRVVLSAHVWVDIVNKDVNKGLGVEILQKRYNCTADETAIFGDYLNDIEMFQKAVYSYAPIHAHEDIKRLAYEIIESNDDWSVANKIKKIIQDKKTLNQ